MPEKEGSIAFKKRKSEKEAQWETISMGRVFHRWPVISIQQAIRGDSKGLVVRDRRIILPPSEKS